MNVTITPTNLKGEVKVPPSKSVAHRLILCSALASGKSVISNLNFSEDIHATLNAVKLLGANVEITDKSTIIEGIKNPPKSAVIDCHESGSTLRFIIPIACALGVNATFLGSANLPKRPITPYLEELTKHGITFDYNNTMPFSVSGKLTNGIYKLRGDISSQFITGLLFALTTLDGTSEIHLTTKLESKPYVDITVDCLNKFGACIEETEQGYKITPKKLFHKDVDVEGDYSQAAFYYVANALGNNINIKGLNEKSYQGDKKIIEICQKSVYNGNVLKPFDLDCSDIPDLVPILTVLACFCDGTSYIKNVRRLRIKECDRLNAMATNLNKLGANIIEHEDSLEIKGIKFLLGGEVMSYNDHRIVMSMAIASTKCTDKLTIIGAEAINKSYPKFFEDFKNIGGRV